MFRLDGKTALVTGGSKGIGFALARALASAGASTVVANRDAARGEESAAILKAQGLPVSFFPADISRQDSIDALFAHVMANHGKLDILVNNAAVIKHLPADEFTEADWQKMVDVNLKGTYFCCQAGWRCMKDHKAGKIINITSVMGVKCSAGRSIYATTKAGINHMTRSLAVEWAADGITVNGLGPGLTITELNKQHYDDHPEDLERIVSKIPLGRVAQPEDYEGAVVFLASAAADYMTGQIILVDGGISMT